LATGVVAAIVLPVGSHPITLVVSDTLAASTNSIIVSVLTTSQSVQRLIRLVNESEIRHPRLLKATLDAALALLGRGRTVAARLELRVFQLQVLGNVALHDPALARQFIRAAQEIIDALRNGRSDDHGDRACLVAHHGGVKGRFSFTTSAGRLHAIEASTNLLDWEVIGVATERADYTFSQVPGTNDASPVTTFDFADPNASAFPQRFYRVVWLP
jgi:hypothetical protein